MASSNKDKHGYGQSYGQGGQGASAVAEQAKGYVDTAKEMAGDTVDKAKEYASAAASKAGDAASYVGDKAQQATSAVGGGMKSLAGTIRDHSGQKGMVGDAAHTVADTLESGGRYLEEHGLKGIADDTTDLIRRNPIPAVLIGLGIGYLIARATRS